MTKKDYVKIAKAIADCAGQNRENYYSKEMRRRIVQSLIIALSENNPRFDSERFAEACGITK